MEERYRRAWKKCLFSCHRVKKIPVYLIRIPNFELQSDLVMIESHEVAVLRPD